MTQDTDYLNKSSDNAVSDIIKGIDCDIEHGEDTLMCGLGIAIMSTFFAPLFPPAVILPLVALTFAISASFARKNYHNMERKFSVSLAQLDDHEQTILRPISIVFAEHPMSSLAESFNPLKNMQRTGKSVLGGILINPFWLPIFYMLGLQINEDKNLILLNKAVIDIEQKISSTFSIVA